jgi:cytochrome c oxidase subunit II
MAPALRRRRVSLLAAAFATFAAAWIAAPAHAISLGPEEAHSPNADDIGTAYWVMLVIAIGLIVLINAALIAAVLRFRERRGREPSRFAAGRGAHRPVVAALALLAVAVFVFGVISTTSVRDTEPSGPNGLGGSATAQVGVSGVSIDEENQAEETGETPATDQAAQSGPLVINAIAQQWLWRFEYPGGRPGQRTFSYGELVVPVDTTVLLNITSTDVVHSWWVPALGGQVQAVPGSTSETWFKADEVGRYPGRSTIFSGTGYPTLRSWVRVVTAPEYQSYVEQLGKDLAQAQGIVQRRQQQQGAPSQLEGGGVP